MKVRSYLVVIFIVSLAVSCRRSEDEISSIPVPDKHALQVRTLNALSTAVEENYVHSDFLGEEWSAVVDGNRNRLTVELADDEFQRMMETILAYLPEGTARLQTREERIRLAASESNTYEGIGSFVALRTSPEKRMVVLSVMPSSPAQLAGLSAHDAILAIGGVPINEGELSRVVERIRGPAGSEVTLSVRSPKGDMREIVVTRNEITSRQNRVFWRPVAEGRMGYFLFPPAAYETLLQDFALGFQAMSEAEMEAIILDLRIVTVGDNWPAATLLTLFADGVVGEIVRRGASEPVTIEGVSEFAGAQSLPVALLVGPSTTGAAEIFAAVMRAGAKATTVGLATPGQVEAMSPFFLPDGSRVLIATSSFQTADGNDVGLSGVMPDVRVDADWDEVTENEDPVVDAATMALGDYSS